MAGQPTVVAGRRRQHELLLSWSGWPLTSILIDPAEIAHVREVGWAGTHHHDAGTNVPASSAALCGAGALVSLSTRQANRGPDRVPDVWLGR